MDTRVVKKFATIVAKTTGLFAIFFGIALLSQIFTNGPELVIGLFLAYTVGSTIWSYAEFTVERERRSEERLFENLKGK